MEHDITPSIGGVMFLWLESPAWPRDGASCGSAKIGGLTGVTCRPTGMHGQGEKEAL